MTESIAVPHAAPLPAAIEQALIAGDLSSLSTEHRVLYYQAKCKSLGLNPLTQPFGFLRLNGKLVLYALKDAKEQLRKIHKVSLEVLEQWHQDTLYFVRVRANTPDGRYDEDMGFAELGNLKGEVLGNAMLKAMTKAKSRVTLSICGLGVIDETEVGSIPGAIIEDSASPAVQKAMGRFHARDAEVKAGAESSEQHEMPRAAAEEEQTSGHPPQETTSPFVHAEKTPGGTPSTVSASPSTPPHEATASAPERKPRQPKPKADRPPGVMYQMNTKQLLQAIQGQLTRLCGTDKDAMRDICRHAFGSLVSTWQGVTELSDQDLRMGLATLEPMVKEEPPAVHHDDSAEEDVPSFPPSDGNPQEGPQETPREEQGSGAILDAGQGSIVNHNGEQVVLPDAPDIVDGYVSPPQVEVLESWAMMYGQHDCFVELTMGCTREAGKICLTPRLWERIIMAVQYRAAHAEAKA